MKSGVTIECSSCGAVWAKSAGFLQIHFPLPASHSDWLCWNCSLAMMRMATAPYVVFGGAPEPQ